MKTLLFALITSLLPLGAQPQKLILDTDMGNDIDDAQALAMIHTLQSRGAVELLAVTSTKDHPLSAAFIDAVNTFYGRPDIPIGVVRQGATRDEGKYLAVANRKDGDGRLIYPHDLASGAEAPEAVALLRKTLAAQPDGSVSIAQVGFFTNLVRLIDSPGDACSPLNGAELVRRKVRQLVIMAGAFVPIGDDRHYREYNVVNDIPAAKALAEKWPGLVIWSGFEIGIAIRYPAASIREDYHYMDHHLIKEAYVAYCGDRGENPTWDLTAVLHLTYPDRGYFSLSECGLVGVADDGFTTFQARADGRHRFLKINPEQAARIREAFVQLCVTPPGSAAKP